MAHIVVIPRLEVRTTTVLLIIMVIVVDLLHRVVAVILVEAAVLVHRIAAVAVEVLLVHPAVEAVVVAVAEEEDK